VTTFAAGPLPVNRASEVATRRPASHPIRTRRPPSSPLSLSATPQLQPAQPFSTRVAKNASGDTKRHATVSLRPGGWPRLASSPTWAAQPQEAQPQGARSKGPGRLATTRQATPQLQPAQHLRPFVAKNASGDTTRHATARLEGVGSLLPLAATNGVETPQWQKAPDTLNVTTLAKPSGGWHSLRRPVTRRSVASPVVTHTATTTLQLQPAQQDRSGVAQNASGDTSVTRHNARAVLTTFGPFFLGAPAHGAIQHSLARGDGRK
jgi:hypothetical protein